MMSFMARASKPRRILVIRAGRLGDTIFASSVIEPLRSSFGSDARIHWVVMPGMEGLFASDPRVERLFPVAHRNLPVGLNLDKLRIVAASWRDPYDLLLNLEMGDQFLGLARLVRARTKIGRPYQRVADDRPEEHAVDHVRRQCSLAVGRDAAQAGVPSLRGGDGAAVRERLGLTGPYLVLHPTNSYFLRQKRRNHRAWPVQHWQELMTNLAAERPETVVLIGGLAESDGFRLLEPLPTGVRSLMGQTTLPQLTEVLRGARALVTTDTGPSHLAAAVGTPVLALIGPTEPRKTGPFVTEGNEVRILRAGLLCSPCWFTGELRRCRENRCMQEIRPDRVHGELVGMLD